MCGIAGILEFDRGANVDERLLHRMCEVMAHRGPDDDGFLVRGPVGLGIRRLSIVDLATGHQPISNEDGSLWIVFNGEIYNHRALREQLITRGHQYRTQSDTETIVHLYEEYGKDCVQRLRGMFAFAVWDAKLKSLFIARDRLGIKPLYYCLTAGRFLFGSEIKVLLAHPSIRAEFNRSALPEYLAFGYLSGEETFYAGVRKLMPGHWMEINEQGNLRIQQYWSLPSQSENAAGKEFHEDRAHDERYYVESYRELLEGAVSSHLMSDVPLGVFLSGGLDSSAVAALMTKIRREPIQTFSVGYAEQTYSELPYARSVARHLGSEHHEVLVTSNDFFSALPKLIWHEDEPIAWPSSVALFFVAQLARASVKVVLTGEGSDETLAGYSRYAFTLKNLAYDRLYRSVVPATFRRHLREFIAGSSLITASTRRKVSHSFLGVDGESWNSLYFDNFFSTFNQTDQTALLSGEFHDMVLAGSGYRNVQRYWAQSSGYDPLQRMLYTDIETYLVELLMKQDNMSMAASIESRVPFLDHVLVEWATRVPARVQIRGNAGKQILKKAMEDLLPREIIYRTKLGFPTPWSGWLAARMDSIEQLLLEPRSIDRGFFNRGAIEGIFREHRAQHRDHYDRIWRLLNLELWYRVCLEGESHEWSKQRSQAREVPTA